MKKTKLLISAAILGGMVTAGSLPALAQGTGEATFSFIENTESPGPMDPENPPQPTQPDPELPADHPNNEGTGNEGPLSLDVVPSLFNFGEIPVDMMGGTYESTLTGVHYLQVTDNRDEIDGWGVLVGRTEFQDAEGAELAATLSLPGGVARNSMTGSAISEDFTHNADGIEIPVASAGGAGTSIFGSAGTNEQDERIGKATSTYTWQAGEETLSIGKGKAKKGTYTSTINWTLTAEVAQ
ncbi:WxL domain-containing protein [Enterococcus sp. AZ109]|uniref:WxL domain-containing protein n=1 Tax=Enterococcus sp. AZ109 TaxID=2774634 RepID=UPI003F205D16